MFAVHQVVKYCWDVYYFKTVWPVFTSLVYVITDDYSKEYSKGLSVHTYSVKFKIKERNFQKQSFTSRIIKCIIFVKGTAVAQWLRCCATNRKVAGSIPDGVTGIFH